MPEQYPLDRLVSQAREAWRATATADTRAKNQALLNMAAALRARAGELASANAADMAAAREQGLPANLVNRLLFDEAKVASRITSLKKIAALADPVGEMNDVQRTENGLLVGRLRVPLGVILMIYEARPHVTVNAGAFALKAGNAIICKGGSEAARCNDLLAAMWSEAVASAGLHPATVQVVSLSHQEVDGLLQRPADIALVIPRGGKKLIQAVAERSRVPVIKHFEGVCHVYLGRQADTTKALNIVLDSKLLMPAVCNAAETVLVDASLKDWLPFLINALTEHGIEVRGCPRVIAAAPEVTPASEADWATEYLDKIYSVRVVDGLDQAMEHIATYGSGHTDVIVTENYSDAVRFQREVDSGVVMINASTMFCDGETLGMGAEIGISTDKLHARGPMGLRELTTYKFAISGDGQVMGDPASFAAGGGDAG